VQIEYIYASKYTAPTVTERHYVKTVVTPDSDCAQNIALPTVRTVVTPPVLTTLTISLGIVLWSLLVTNFLQNGWKNAENGAKFPFRPYVQFDYHYTGFHETQNSSAA
jgi:hypothetical protein